MARITKNGQSTSRLVAMTSCMCLLLLPYHGGHCKIPLHIAGLQEMSNLPFWYKICSALPDIIERTLEKINNHTDILVDYELHMVYGDTQFRSGMAARRMTELLSTDPPKVAVYGPGWSDHVAYTGKISQFYNIIQVAYFDSTAKLADHRKYPTLYTVNQIFDVFNPLFIKLMRYFGWTRMGAITDPGDFYDDQLETLRWQLEPNNITLISSAVLSRTSSASDIVARFKEFDVRIILMSIMNKAARQVFCQAYHQNMFGSGYVWIVIGPFMKFGKLIRDADSPEKMGCTKEELLIASAGHFVLDYYVISRTDTPTISGERPSEVMDDIMSLIPRKLISPWSTWYSDNFGSAADGLWALALGLNHSLAYLKEAGLELQEYNYTKDYLDAIDKGMQHVTFNGVSGPVSFNNKGQRIGVTYIQRAFNDTWTDVASYDRANSDELDWIVDPATLWPGGNAPKDSFVYQSKIQSPNIGAAITVVIINTSGIVLSLGFLFFNIYYRNTRSLKMSSPMLNNVILVGSLVMYLEVMVLTLDYMQALCLGTRAHLCMVHAWLMSLGFTTLFGALFSKTYRVYFIFRSYQVNRRHIKDVHLFGIIGGLIAIDVFIVLPWTGFHPLVEEEALLTKNTIVESNVILSETYRFCYNTYQAYWIAAMYAYKGLLLSFGTFLAWETRHVTVPELNDSKYIGACIYNVVTVCIFGVPLLHVLPAEEVTMKYVLESCLIVFCTTLCQCIIFLPKIQRRNDIYPRFVRDHASQKTVSTMNGSPDGSTKIQEVNTISVLPMGDGKKDMDQLALENRSLRMQIAQETIAISKLRRCLRQMSNLHFYKSGSQYVVFKTEAEMTSTTTG